MDRDDSDRIPLHYACCTQKDPSFVLHLIQSGKDTSRLLRNVCI